MCIFVWGVGVGLTHTKNLITKSSGKKEKRLDCKWNKRKLSPLLEEVSRPNLIYRMILGEYLDHGQQFHLV